MKTRKNTLQTILPTRTLLNFGWRYLLRHPWQTLLMVIGITLGVAVVIAIDLANASASQAFDLSTEAVAGRTTHQIVAGPQGLDEEIYTNLRRQGLALNAAPVIVDYVSSPQLGNRAMQLLAIDPFAEAPFRSYLSTETGVPVADLTRFLAIPGAVLISTDLAERYTISTGMSISLTIAGREQPAVVVGLLQPSDNLSRRALGGIVLVDIATGQELTGRLGRLDRIDLILPVDSGELLEQISASLPADARILPAEARSGVIKELTAAFRTNLTALSLLALVVGLFLIYNTITFSVVQRRSLFGTLRCLGVTRREVFSLVISEALLVGIVGAALGLALGILLGQSALRMVTQTINDLYFVVTVRAVRVATSSLIKGTLLGIAATVLTAAPPAWEAASVPPRAALSRSGLESKARQAVLRVAAGGLALLAFGGGILTLPTGSLVISFGALSAITLGFAALTPLFTELFMGGLAPVLGRLWGALGRKAPRDVIKSLSRTSIAVAALMVAMAVTIGISLMISSFRQSVVLWLERAVQADIHITASNLTARQDLNPIDPSVIEAAEEWPEIVLVERIRGVTVDSPHGPIFIEASTSPDYGEGLIYLSAEGSPEEVWQAVRSGSVIVSEPLANRIETVQRGMLTLYTDQGAWDFPIAGVYSEYASTQGTVIMSLNTYQLYWEDDSVTSLALFLEAGAVPDQVVLELQNALSSMQQLFIRPNRALREAALVIFDRTFAITGSLQLLATVVAFVGVLSSLLALQLDRQREFGILRAIGLTARQLWGLVLLETGLMGTVAGLLSMPTGIVLSWILVHVINRRAFNWTLQLQVTPAPFLQALLAAVLAALLAGIYPAHKMGHAITAEALRNE
jgi:putative ABC transport system permease protein